MSTPPPPSPFGPTPGSSAGFDRRAYKAQQRMAEAQARLQRDQMRAQLRAQNRAARRSSIVGPVLLVALGVVLLLLQTGRLHWTNALTWLGRWWPAVLILAGILMLVEWALDRRQLAGAGSGLVPKRILGGGTVTLLVLLGIVGAGVMIAENSSLWMRHNLDEQLRENGFGDWRKIPAFRSEFTNELQANMSPAGTMIVDSPRGDVTITGSSTDGQAHVTIHQHIFAWESSDVDDRRRSERVQLSGDPNHLLLAVPAAGQDDADLTIELPHDAAVVVHNTHGDIALEELRGAVDISARGGDVKLTAVRGPVHLQTQDDNATVTAHSLGSGLTLDGRTGDIDLSDIDGAVSLHGDFFGTTHLEHIRGGVHFQSSFTDFACAGILGDVTVEGRSDLDAHKLIGPVKIATTNRNLALNDIRGATTVTDRNGSVTVTVSGPPQPVHIANENGSVELSIPAGQGFLVQARTQNGKIENDFGLESQTSGGSAKFTGQLGHGGPLLYLETNEGDVTLSKSSGDDDADWDKAPPRITPAPVSPDHNRAGRGTSANPARSL